jgi:hypothetical protein
MPVKSIRLAPLLVLALLTAPSALAAQKSDPQPCPSSPSDQTQIVDTINGLFAAAQIDDLAKFHNLTDPAFYAYDNGKRFDGDALMDLIRGYHTQGYVFVWTVNDPVVHIACNTAWVTYVNRGSITLSGVTTPMQWLESDVLQKESGTWRILFLHSTRVPQSQPQQQK